MKILANWIFISAVFISTVSLFSSCEQSEPPEIGRIEDTITFSGYNWKIIHSETAPRFPANNLFSKKANDIWIDNLGHLHMGITKHNQTWFATEIESDTTMGYGVYSFTLFGDLKNIAENVVFRFFTFDRRTGKSDMHSNIDIEFNYRGLDTLNSPLTYSVEPVFYDNGDTKKYNYTEREKRPGVEMSDLLVGQTTHTITWKSFEIIWESYAGSPDNRGELLGRWIFDDTKPGRLGFFGQNADNSNSVKVPVPGNETKVHFQCWIETSINRAPLDLEEEEIILESFSYDPF